MDVPQTGSQRGLPRNGDDGGHRTDGDLVGTALLGVACVQCRNEEVHAEFLLRLQGLRRRKSFHMSR